MKRTLTALAIALFATANADAAIIKIVDDAATYNVDGDTIIVYEKATDFINLANPTDTVDFSGLSGTDLVFQVNHVGPSNNQGSRLWVREGTTWYESTRSKGNTGLKTYNVNDLTGTSTFNEKTALGGSTVASSTLDLGDFTNVTAIGIWLKDNSGTGPSDDYKDIEVFASVTPIPEPASLALVGVGSLLMLTGRRRR